MARLLVECVALAGPTRAALLPAAQDPRPSYLNRSAPPCHGFNARAIARVTSPLISRMSFLAYLVPRISLKDFLRDTLHERRDTREAPR